MAFLDKLYQTNFIEYASYVIKDRAIPNVDDGLKPVQRRILHSLFEMDDGKFHKVANVVGHSMKYHPHGDASIYSALVIVANKEMFIDRQGNFGNVFTGDPASAARYIECRVSPMAKEILYNPKITRYEDSYDSRNKEPVTFPAKIPVLLAHGAEGIAVGMATKIMPHNLIECIEAQVACLQNKSFQLYPDFITRGQADVSEYNDGNGKIRVRARFDILDPKKIIIKDIPFGTTTESLITSIENAAKKNKVRIASINDYTAEEVEIEIKLGRGEDASDVVDALYAFTDCETSVACNMVVIKDRKPLVMTVTEIIQYNSEKLVDILKAELELEAEELKDKLHAKTLEQIFIENRVYKSIEKMDSSEKVNKAVKKGMDLYKNIIKREVTKEDIETLLRIPIRRISLYDINKARKEMAEIRKRLKEIKGSLDNLTKYSISFLKDFIKKYRDQYPRRTEIVSFEKVSVREAAKRDLKLCYDKKTGYLGTRISGDMLVEVSQYDRVLIIRKKGDYSVVEVPEKLFVDKGIQFCGFIEKDRIYNIIYKNKVTGCAYIKRCHIEKFILNKEYALVPDDVVILDFTTDSDRCILLNYKEKPRMRTLQETFLSTNYPIRGTKAGGIRLASRELKNGKFIAKF